jgi:AraC-like DNA-binding protein
MEAIFRHYVPVPPLSDFVALFWYWKGSSREQMKERLLPGATVEFVVRLTKDHTTVYQRQALERPRTCSGAIITGPQSEFFVLDKSEQDELVGVHFKPGGSFPFFGAPADEFLNDHVSLDCVWGADAGRLRSRLLEAETVESRFKILETRLLEKLAQAQPRHRAVAYALNELSRGPFAAPLSAVASAVNLSPKRLTQLFNREIGVTPKLFARLGRFHGALRAIGRGRADWLDLALECGYYDQAHFNHDFLEFSGINPTAYIAKKTDDLFHVPL